MEVLLIDDDEDATFLTKMIFESSDVVDTSVIYNSAQESLAYLKIADRLPDCILVDIRMPGMTGIEFVERFEKIKRHDIDQSNVFILSSSLMKSEKEKSVSFKSVAGFIEKPLDFAKLQYIKDTLSEGQKVSLKAS